MERVNDQMERRLVRQISEQGNESAFRQLYRRHSPAIYGLLLRLLGGREPEAQDLLQETWVRAVERLSSFRWESALRTWLCGIAVHCAREQQRRESKLSLEPLDEPGDLAAVGPRPDLGGRLDWERAIRGLPNGYRQVLVLCDIEGYTHKEVAALLGISAGTSKSQLARARRALRTWCGTEGGTS